VQAATVTASLWNNAAIPKTLSDSDTQSVEIGTRFKATYAGEVTGVKFYKGPQNTSTHIGSLWQSDGKKLASVTFKNETASGWQTATFAEPVAISANTTYIVSYFAPKGRYSANNNYFAQAYTNGPLTAPKGAGVYAYSPRSTFPSQRYANSNYWVDVLFSTSRFNPTPKPQAPTALAATATGTTVSLSWAASQSTSIARYEVFRNGQSIAATAGTAAAYADTGLTGNTEYTYKVRAVDSAGTASDFSNTVTVKTPVSPPPTTPNPTPTPTPTTPTPTPTPGQLSCATTKMHVPDGPDGMGGCWPGPSNTGVPAGTQLSDYTGPCTITSGTVVIENKNIKCDGFRVQNASTVVVVRKSKINTSVFNENDGSLVPGKLTLEDVTVSGINDPNYSALMYINNVTVIRSNISSGQHNIQCVDNCVVRDSYLHDQTLSGQTHNNAFMTNGGSDMTLVHNTLNCSVPNKAPDGGCSSDLTLLGDFAVVQRVLVDKNLLMANNVGESYCAYGGTASSKKFPNPNNIVYTNNVFQRGTNGKCASAGPITGFDTARPGNKWENNKWDDGAVVPPAL